MATLEATATLFRCELRRPDGTCGSSELASGSIQRGRKRVCDQPKLGASCAFLCDRVSLEARTATKVVIVSD